MPMGENEDRPPMKRRGRKWDRIGPWYLRGSLAVAAFFSCMLVDLAGIPLPAGLRLLAYLGYSLSLPLVVAALSGLAVWDLATRLVRAFREGLVGPRSWQLTAFWIFGLGSFLAVSAVFRFGYEREPPVEHAVELPFGLKSHADPEEVQRVLHLDSLPRATYEAVYPSRWWGPCPRYEERHFAFGEYGFRGVAGNLEGMFLNGHLYQVVLFIRDGADRRRLADELVGVGQDTAVSSTPGASVRVSGAGVVWTDVRLERGVSALFWFCLPRSEWFVP